MKITGKKYHPFLLLIVVIASCNEPLQPDPGALGYEYFPLNTGEVRIYDVVRIDHTIDLASDTTLYQLKEVVGNKFVSGGEENYRIERYVRQSAMDEWQIDSVWSARTNTYQAIVTENNVPFIKMTFPVQEGRSWDGNAMNIKDFDQYKLVDLGLPNEINGVNYSNTVRLEKEDVIDPCQTTTDRFNIEVFASNIGMIYRADIFRKYVSSNDCPGPGIIEFGQELEYKLLEYQSVD